MTHRYQRLGTRMGGASLGRGAAAVLSEQLANCSGHSCDRSSHMALVPLWAPSCCLQTHPVVVCKPIGVLALAMTPFQALARVSRSHAAHS